MEKNWFNNQQSATSHPQPWEWDEIWKMQGFLFLGNSWWSNSLIWGELLGREHEGKELQTPRNEIDRIRMMEEVKMTRMHDKQQIVNTGE